MDYKECSIEHAIIYLTYAKAIIKPLSEHINKFCSKGIFDEAEQALIDSLLIGMTRLDGEFIQAIEHCLQRTHKSDHILLAINQVLKDKGIENDNSKE